MGTIKDRNGMDLTEAEDIKKRWQLMFLGLATEPPEKSHKFCFSSVCPCSLKSAPCVSGSHLRLLDPHNNTWYMCVCVRESCSVMSDSLRPMDYTVHGIL